MKRGPSPGSRHGATSAHQKALSAWGESIRPEVIALAEACDRNTASAVAKQLGYSAGLVSYVLANRYPGDVETVLAKVRGRYMAETVLCPVLGEIGLHRCLNEQKRPFAATNSTRARLYHACKTCPEAHPNRAADLENNGV
jgi:hypothetical protein